MERSEEEKIETTVANQILTLQEFCELQLLSDELIRLGFFKPLAKAIFLDLVNMADSSSRNCLPTMHTVKVRFIDEHPYYLFFIEGRNTNQEDMRQYESPEYRPGETYRPQHLIWAAGIVLYFFITQEFYTSEQEEQRGLDLNNLNVPYWIRQIVRRTCLQEDPDRRRTLNDILALINDPSNCDLCVEPCSHGQEPSQGIHGGCNECEANGCKFCSTLFLREALDSIRYKSETPQHFLIALPEGQYSDETFRQVCREKFDLLFHSDN